MHYAGLIDWTGLWKGGPRGLEPLYILGEAGKVPVLTYLDHGDS